MGEFEDLGGFGFVGGVARVGSEGVCAGAEGGEIDTDQSEAVCDVFVIEGAVTDPALCAGEVINRFGALDAGRDLWLLLLNIRRHDSAVTYHHCPYRAKYRMAHLVIELIRAS